MNRGGKFLIKEAVVLRQWKVLKENLVQSTELLMQIGHCKGFISCVDHKSLFL